MHIEVVDGGLICSSSAHVEELGDKNEDCYIVNAALLCFHLIIDPVTLTVSDTHLKSHCLQYSTKLSPLTLL